MYSPATRIRGFSDSNPRSANCSRLRLTCSRSASLTSSRAACSSLNRAGTLFVLITVDVPKARGEGPAIVFWARALRRYVPGSSVLRLVWARVDNVRSHIAHDGQKKVALRSNGRDRLFTSALRSLGAIEARWSEVCRAILAMALDRWMNLVSGSGRGQAWHSSLPGSTYKQVYYLPNPCPYGLFASTK